MQALQLWHENFQLWREGSSSLTGDQTWAPSMRSTKVLAIGPTREVPRRGLTSVIFSTCSPPSTQLFAEGISGTSPCCSSIADFVSQRPKGPKALCSQHHSPMPHNLNLTLRISLGPWSQGSVTIICPNTCLHLGYGPSRGLVRPISGQGVPLLSPNPDLPQPTCHLLAWMLPLDRPLR